VPGRLRVLPVWIFSKYSVRLISGAEEWSSAGVLGWLDGGVDPNPSVRRVGEGESVLVPTMC